MGFRFSLNLAVFGDIERGVYQNKGVRYSKKKKLSILPFLNVALLTLWKLKVRYIVPHLFLSMFELQFCFKFKCNLTFRVRSRSLCKKLSRCSLSTMAPILWYFLIFRHTSPINLLLVISRSSQFRHLSETGISTLRQMSGLVKVCHLPKLSFHFPCYYCLNSAIVTLRISGTTMCFAVE